MAELETLLAQVWNPETRPLAEEAARCYNAGVFRASIASTWAAVTADIISKLLVLADDGESRSVAFRERVPLEKSSLHVTRRICTR